MRAQLNPVVGIGSGRWQAVLRGITGRKRADAELEKRAERQVAIADLAQRALKGTGVQTLMREATDALVVHLVVDHATVLELRPDGDRLPLRAAVGWRGGAVGAGRVPAGLASHARYTLRKRGPVVVEDARLERRFRGAEHLLEHGVVSGVTAPIEGGGLAVGVLGAHATQRRQFAQDEVRFVQAMAAILGAALNARRAEQLEYGRHQAERVEAVGQLAAGVAHEFNNLLGVILNYTSFAIEELGDEHPDVRDDLEEVKRAAERGSLLSRRLVLLGRREPAEAPIDVNAVITETWGLLQSTLGDIRLETDLAPGALRTRVGAGEVEEVLVNLVVNARDTMPRGGRLRIETRPVALGWEEASAELPSGPYVRLTVMDSGAGMAKGTAERAFEPFFTTKAGEVGKGLGLATVRGIVAQAGGRVTLDSEPARGTSVRIELPLVSEALAREAEAGVV